MSLIYLLGRIWKSSTSHYRYPNKWYEKAKIIGYFYWTHDRYRIFQFTPSPTEIQGKMWIYDKICAIIPFSQINCHPFCVLRITGCVNHHDLIPHVRTWVRMHGICIGRQNVIIKTCFIKHNMRFVLFSSFRVLRFKFFQFSETWKK